MYKIYLLKYSQLDLSFNNMCILLSISYIAFGFFTISKSVRSVRYNRYKKQFLRIITKKFTGKRCLSGLILSRLCILHKINKTSKSREWKSTSRSARSGRIPYLLKLDCQTCITVFPIVLFFKRLDAFWKAINNICEFQRQYKLCWKMALKQ